MSDFKVGERVRVLTTSEDRENRGKAGTIITVDKYILPIGVEFDDGSSKGQYDAHELERMPESKPLAFRVGDKVGCITDPTRLGTVVETHPDHEHGWVYRVRFDSGHGAGRFGRYMEGELQYAPIPDKPQSQEFKLRAGDKIRNTLTGREGIVYEAPLSRTLKVYDVRPPYRDGVPVSAVEEYEVHHPGTYDFTHRAHKIGPF